MRCWPLGASVRAYDPVASAQARGLYAGKAHAERLLFCKDAYEAAQGADALLIATEWKEFRSPDYDRLRELLRSAADIRRAQSVRPGADAAVGLPVLRDRPRGAQVPVRAQAAVVQLPEVDLPTSAPC